MTTSGVLKFDGMTVREIFANGVQYVVPKYQRGYSWTEENVKELLGDLRESFLDSPNENYLLGQIIVCPSTPGNSRVESWDIIDGQQRLTTLYLFLLYMLKRIEQESAHLSLKRAQDKAHLNTSLYRFGSASEIDPRFLGANTVEADSSGMTPIPLLRVAADGEYHILRLINDGSLAEQVVSPTQHQLKEAYECIDSFMLENFDSLEERWEFLDYVTEYALVIKLSLIDANHALRVFLKVNNRGLALDDADLLKSLLFQKISSDNDFEQMSDNWDTASKRLYEAKLKKVRSMEFLMKLMIGIRTGHSVSSGRLFNTWSQLLTSETEAKNFGRALPRKAKTLSQISNGKFIGDGVDAEIHLGTQTLKMVQHLELLLAASHLPIDMYQIVARAVEDRSMLSVLANEKNQDFERKLHTWSRVLNEIPLNASREQVREGLSVMTEDCEELFKDLRRELRKLSYSTTSHRTKLRYVLARTARSIQEVAFSSHLPLSTYMQASRRNSRGFDIDHIFPVSDSQSEYWKGHTESSESIASTINGLGNLTLLHPQDNRSQSDALPWETEKLDNFNKSELWVNRILTTSDFSRIGSRNAETLRELLVDCPPISAGWGAREADARLEFYCRVIERDMRQGLFPTGL